MKQFIPTYLYIKTHNVTGLKYFGKTTNDPNMYRGSGKYWLAHIKKYGYNVTTEIFGYYTEKEQCIAAATQFSKDTNIVYAVNNSNKKIWANQIIENGIDGGAARFGPHSVETKQKISDAKTGKYPSNKTKNKIREARKLQDMSHMKKPKSEEQKKKISNTLAGRTQSAETKAKKSAKLLGHVVTLETREKISAAHKGKTVSEETRQKMRNKTLTNEQKQHLSEINLGKRASDSTKQKLSGMVVAIDKLGNAKRILKEIYYAQSGPKEEWEWVSHRSTEARMRRG